MQVFFHQQYPPKFNSSPLKIGNPKRKLIFQPSIFRGDSLNFQGVCDSLSPFCWSVGWVTSIPQALDFKPSKPKVLGWFHVAAGYHIIGDYAVGHLGPALVSWAVLKFDSRNDESRGKTAVRHCEICVFIPMYINIHITDIDLQLYTSRLKGSSRGFGKISPEWRNV